METEEIIITEDGLKTDPKMRLEAYKRVLSYLERVHKFNLEQRGGFCVIFNCGNFPIYNLNFKIDVYDQNRFKEYFPELYAQKPTKVFIAENGVEYWFCPGWVEPRIECLKNAIKMIKSE